MLGTSIGPYQILEKLGAGGMGEVFLGHDPRLERHVALKCLTAAAGGASDGHTRVLREARAVARLTHPNIAGVYDVLEQDGRAYIVMEYVEGISLAAHMASGPLPPAEVRMLGRQLASALAAAHAQGVIHRDLKPANIQVMRDGSIKVLDFGVARLMPSPQTVVDTTIGDGGLHSLGGNPGTPLYMAPEQLIGHVADARTDLYSAGVILFLMATGRRPYLNTTAVTLALAMNADPAPAARSINPLVPLELSDAIGKALKRNPAHRYQSARELDAALAAMSGTSSGTRAVGPPDSGAIETPGFARRYGWMLAAAAAVLLTIGVAARKPLMIGLGLSHPAPVSGTPIRRAVAVLPLDNLSGDASKGYLGTGVSETLTMALSKMPGLTVLSRSEVQEEARREHDVRKVARDLDVSFIVDGSVQQAGDRLRITLRVIRPDGTVAWSDAYEDDTSAIFAMHRTMAADLVTQMEGRSDGVDLTVPTTVSVDALTAYWQGRATSDRAVSNADFNAAIASFRQAIARDPKFALGYAGLADTLWEQYRVIHDPALPQQALDAGLTALRLDPRQPATRVAVATVYQGLGQNEAAADQLLLALELQPSNDGAHRILARVLATQGKSEQAIGELQQALAYRPRGLANYNALGRLYYDLRRLPESAATFQRALEIAPDDARTYLSLGGVYLEMRDFDRAIEMFHRSNTVTPTGLAQSNLGTAYYRMGRFDDAAKAYEAAVRLEAKAPLTHGNLGDAYVRLNRKADAAREFTIARQMALDALRVNAKDVRAMSRAAGYEAKLGLKAEASAHAAKAVALAPRDPDVQYKRAVVASLAGDRATALRALDQALTLGFKADDARNDYDLAGLKNSPEFTALLSSHR